MNKTEEFLDEVCSRIWAKSVHADVRAELSSHIDEIIEAGVASGQSRETAEKAALTRMGSPEEIGLKLDKKHRPRTEWPLFIAAAIIAAAGIAVCINAGIGQLKSVYILAGFALMTGMMFVDCTRVGRAALPVYIGTVSAMLILAASRRVVSCTAVLALAQFCPPLFIGLLFMKKKYNPVQLIGLCILMFLPFAAVAMCFHAAYVLLLAMSYLVIFTVLAVRGSRTARILLPVNVAFGALPLAVMLISQQWMRDRIEVFFTAGATDPNGAGWLAMQAGEVIKNARPLGGISGGFPDVFNNYFSEYALVGILGRCGWIPTAAIILAAALLLWRLFVAAAKVRDPYGFALALSGSTVLALRFIVNILMNFNLFPGVGIGLPIVGGGGADCLACFVLMGLVLSVCRRRDITAKIKPASNAARVAHKIVDTVFGE